MTVDAVDRILAQSSPGDPLDHFRRIEGVARFADDELAACAPQADVGRLGDMNADLVGAEEMLVVLGADDHAGDRDVPQASRNIERLDQQWGILRRIPLGDDDLGGQFGTLELMGQAMHRPADPPNSSPLCIRRSDRRLRS